MERGTGLMTIIFPFILITRTRYTYKTFSHEKSVLVRDFGFIGEQLGISRYPPYSESKINTLNQ